LLLQSVLIIPLVLSLSLSASLLLSLTIDISSEDDRTAGDNAVACSGVTVMVIPRCLSSCCCRCSLKDDEEEDEGGGDLWFIILLDRGDYVLLCDQFTSACVCEFCSFLTNTTQLGWHNSTGGTTIAVGTKH
jgi:hypothetical protein